MISYMAVTVSPVEKNEHGNTTLAVIYVNQRNVEIATAFYVSYVSHITFNQTPPFGLQTA